MVKLSEQLFPSPWYRKYLLLIVVLIVIIGSLAVWQLLFSNIQAGVTTTTIPSITTTTVQVTATTIPSVTTTLSTPTTTVQVTTTTIIGLESLVQEKVNQCREDNPSATESYCYDVAYHDIAIERKDKTFCEKIQDDYLKNHCSRFF